MEVLGFEGFGGGTYRSFLGLLLATLLVNLSRVNARCWASASCIALGMNDIKIGARGQKRSTIPMRVMPLAKEKNVLAHGYGVVSQRKQKYAMKYHTHGEGRMN